MSPSIHTMKLAGKIIMGDQVVALAKMAFSQRSGVTLKLSVRSKETHVAQLILDAIA